MRYEYLTAWSPEFQNPQGIRITKRLRDDVSGEFRTVKKFHRADNIIGTIFGNGDKTGCDDLDFFVVTELLKEELELFSEHYNEERGTAHVTVDGTGSWFLQAPDGESFAAAVVQLIPSTESNKRMNRGLVSRCGWLSFFTDGYGEPPMWINIDGQVFYCRTRRASAIYGFCVPGSVMQVMGIFQRQSQMSYSIIEPIETFPSLIDRYKVQDL